MGLFVLRVELTRGIPERGSFCPDPYSFQKARTFPWSLSVLLPAYPHPPSWGYNCQRQMVGWSCAELERSLGFPIFWSGARQPLDPAAIWFSCVYLVSCPLLSFLSFQGERLISWACGHPKLKLLSQCPLWLGIAMRLSSAYVQVWGLAFKRKGMLFLFP